MPRRIVFNFNPEKFVSASAYLVERCPAVTKMKLAKLLYYADKAHFLRYGRPVTGDRYIRMQYGPVPSRGYDLMKGDDRASQDAQDLFNRHLIVDGNDLRLRMPANLDWLADSDREVLSEVAARLGPLTAAELSARSHHEPAWNQAAENGEMDFRLFFVGQDTDRSVQGLVESNQQLADALNEMEIEEIIASL